MKQLLLIRHAKSSWDFSAMNDFDRQLNERGHKDAPAMANHLIKKQIAIDAFVSSPAKRALTTATYFITRYNEHSGTSNSIMEVPILYHASSSVFYEVIAGLNNSYRSVAIFSHNPGITEFVNDLTDVIIDDMPTCGVFAIRVDTDDWSKFEKCKKSFLFFESPKIIAG